MATSIGSATPSSGRHMRPARHKIPNAILSDPERAHDLDRRAIVQGSDQDHNMLRFPMISISTCHRFKIARKRRSSGLCPPRTRPSAKIRRRAGLRALNIQTGRVTPGTPASGRPGSLADGPGSTFWGARKSDGGLIAVMCCLMCQSSPRLMRPFPEKVKDSDGTNPLSRDLPPRSP